MTLRPVDFVPLQPTHTAVMECTECGHIVRTVALQLKPPGARARVWVYPYGYPDCPQCGGKTQKTSTQKLPDATTK